jgi:hypothetical protein
MERKLGTRFNSFNIRSVVEVNSTVGAFLDYFRVTTWDPLDVYSVHVTRRNSPLANFRALFLLLIDCDIILAHTYIQQHFCVQVGLVEELDSITALKINGAVISGAQDLVRPDRRRSVI